MHTPFRCTALLLPLLIGGAAAQSQRPKVGDPAPVFTALDQDGNKVTVGGKSKTWTVLAFYPKAMTGG